MSNKQLEELRSEYVEKTQQAQKQKATYAVMHNLYRLTEAQKESIKTLAVLDDLSGGKLEDLINVYKTIKTSKPK